MSTGIIQDKFTCLRISENQTEEFFLKDVVPLIIFYKMSTWFKTNIKRLKGLSTGNIQNRFTLLRIKKNQAGEYFLEDVIP